MELSVLAFYPCALASKDAPSSSLTRPELASPQLRGSSHTELCARYPDGVLYPNYHSCRVSPHWDAMEDYKELRCRRYAYCFCIGKPNVLPRPFWFLALPSSRSLACSAFPMHRNVVYAMNQNSLFTLDTHPRL